MLFAFGGDVCLMAARMGLRQGGERRADTVSACFGQSGGYPRLEQLLGVGQPCTGLL
jgi:hypothetical protein